MQNRTTPSEITAMTNGLASGCRALRTTTFAALLLGLCGGALALPPNLPEGTPLRIIFATSTTHDGAIGGLAGADSLVGAAASAPGSLLAGISVTAVLSVTGTLAPSRFVDNGEPIYNTRGELVAPNLAAMFAGAGTTLSNAVQYDELGVAHSGTVWTGTNADGTLAPTHCTNYSTNTDQQDGRIGYVDEADLEWVEFGTLNCINPARLYGLSAVVVAPHTPGVPIPTLGAWAWAALVLALGVLTVSIRRRV